MSDTSFDMVCKALEMADNAITYYTEATASCTDSLGGEVFETLAEDKKKHMQRIQEVHAGLSQGQSFDQACTLDEEEREDINAVFGELAAKYQGQTCPASEKDALDTALDMEKSILDFYSTSLANASEDTEKKFLEQLVGDVRKHLLLLEDMHHYYDDPEAWLMSKSSAGLDGA